MMRHIPYNYIYRLVKPLYTITLIGIPVYSTIKSLDNYKTVKLDSHMIDIHDSLY